MLIRNVSPFSGFFEPNFSLQLRQSATRESGKKQSFPFAYLPHLPCSLSPHNGHESKRRVPRIRRSLPRVLFPPSNRRRIFGFGGGLGPPVFPTPPPMLKSGVFFPANQFSPDLWNSIIPPSRWIREGANHGKIPADGQPFFFLRKPRFFFGSAASAAWPKKFFLNWTPLPPELFRPDALSVRRPGYRLILRAKERFADRESRRGRASSQSPCTPTTRTAPFSPPLPGNKIGPLK